MTYLRRALVAIKVSHRQFASTSKVSGIAKTGQLQLVQPFMTLGAAAYLLSEAVGLIHAGFAGAVMVCVALSRSLRVARSAAVTPVMMRWRQLYAHSRCC
jgi:hypothetical protein